MPSKVDPLDAPPKSKTSKSSSDPLGGGGSSHSRSSHQKGEFVSVTVRKDHPKQKAGIRLEQESNGRVKISNIASNGLFADSEIEIGDIVMSINAKRLQAGQGPQFLVDVVNKASSKVTMVVKKTYMPSSCKNAKGPRDLAGAQDNNQTGEDAFYGGVAKHNADGSLDRKFTEKDKDKKKQVVTTITAHKKVDDDDDAGLDFEVRDLKLYVSAMAEDSPFQETDLEVGDHVVSICDMNFRSYANANYALATVKKSKAFVTLVVEKQQKKKKRSSSTPSKKKTTPSKSKEIQSDDETAESSTSSTVQDEVWEEMIISAPKTFASQRVGLSFKADMKAGYVVVNEIKAKSIFLKTTLSPGDRILAINDVDFRNNPDKNLALATCQETKECVSLLIARNMALAQAGQFDLDASSTNLCWQ